MADDGESDAPLVPKPEPKHDVGVCRLMLLGLVLLVVLSYSALLIEDHILSSPATAQNRKAKTDLKSSWLKLHNPKTAHHDAELLRRRMLAGLVELPPSQLAEHVPAIAASLDHEDQHIRALAISMLGRLEPPAIAEHSDVIAARLAHDDDDQVRLAAVRALERGAPPAILARHATALVKRLGDAEPAVRWAAVDALGLLDADALASVTLTAIDALLQQHDVSIAKAAVGSWTRKLSGTHPKVMASLAALSGQLERHQMPSDQQVGGAERHMNMVA